MHTPAQDWKVPTDPVLNSIQAYKSYEPDVLACAAWLAMTPIDSAVSKRKEAYSFFMKWTAGAPNVNITLSMSVFDKEVDPPDLLFMFMVGWAEYVLTHPGTDRNQVKGNTAGLAYIVKYYKAGKGLHKSDWLEEITKANDKGKLEVWVADHL